MKKKLKVKRLVLHFWLNISLNILGISHHVAYESHDKKEIDKCFSRMFLVFEKEINKC